MLKLSLSPRREASPLPAVPVCLSLRATPRSPHALTHWGEAVQVRPVCLSLQRPQQLVAPPPATPQDPVFEDCPLPFRHQEDVELHAEEDQLAGLRPPSACQRGAAKVRLPEWPVSNGSPPLELRVWEFFQGRWEQSFQCSEQPTGPAVETGRRTGGSSASVRDFYVPRQRIPNGGEACSHTGSLSWTDPVLHWSPDFTTFERFPQLSQRELQSCTRAQLWGFLHAERRQPANRPATLT